MSYRITRTMLDDKFRLYCATFGFPTAAAGQYPDHGDYLLESHQAGYLIARVSATTSGTSNPLGDRLMSPAELWHAMSFAIDSHWVAVIS